MKVNFRYDKDKDIWCLLNKGKSSYNSSLPTKVYEQLVEVVCLQMLEVGDNPTEADAAIFIEKYKMTHAIDADKLVGQFQEEWESVSDEFQKIAESVFGVSLPQDIVAYLTINTRCPYSIENNYFYISTQSTIKTTLHELWHFYTWYGLGVEEEIRLGKQKYNDLKECLTVLLNVVCKDLLPTSIFDIGYPQHQALRKEILELWEKEKDIHKLWSYLTQTK